MTLVFIWVNTTGIAGACASMVYQYLFIIVQLSRSINNRDGYKVRQLHDVKLLPLPTIVVSRLSPDNTRAKKMQWPRQCLLGCKKYNGKNCKRIVNEL